MENKKITVLAIDDNKDNLISLKALIKEAFPDAEFLTALNGKKGLELAAAKDPDVILLDIVMPGMDGYEVCQKLKADQKLSDTPVVFVTALKGDKESRIRALECGADAFLSKPIDESELTAQIRAMLKIKTANIGKREEKERLAVLLEERTKELKETYTSALNLLEDLKTENETRRKSEEALREEQLFSKAIIDSLPNLYFLYSYPECKLISWNKRHETDLGYTADELKGRYVLDFHAPEYKELIMAAIKTVMEVGYGSSDDVLVTKDGRKIPYFSTAVRFESKGKLFLMGICEDITERKRAEEQLIQQTEAMEAAIDGIAILNQDGNYVYINKAHASIYGYNNADELIGKPWTIFYNPDEIQRFNQEIMPEFNQKKHWKGEAIGKKADGETYPQDLSLTRLNNGGMICVVRDITERKHADVELQKYREHLEDLVKERTAKLEKINIEMQSEMAERVRIDEELAKERNLLRTLIDNLPFEIYAKNSKSKFIMANSHVLKSLRKNKFEDIIDKTDFDLLPRELALKYYSDEQNVLSSDGRMITYEESAADESGNIRWYSIIKVPVRNNENNVIGLVGINRDITAVKRAEDSLKKSKDEAEAANRAKSTFLSSMSHEIRTPLNAILGFSQLMLNDENLNPEQIDWLETINRSGEHLLTLINDILEISKIEAGRAIFNPSSFDLHSLVNDIEAMFKIKTNSKNLSLLTELSNDLPKSVVTDEGKLRQILINIVGNAVKFTQEGGIALRVRTDTERDGKMILIAEVEDTGPGISDKDIEKLFQMFGQTETGIKEGGTGLGLLISREYARIMGGDITVTSEFGKGTCFTIKIKIEKDAESSKKIETSQARVIGLAPGQNTCRILIVDDQQDNRALLSKMLTSVGFEVMEAMDGKDAIEKFKSWSPDLILMDISMPVMDGYEATRRIKEMDTKKTPVIAVTASAFYEDKLNALGAGAVEYIRKPFKRNEILKHIESYLGVQYVYEQKK